MSAISNSIINMGVVVLRAARKILSLPAISNRLFMPRATKMWRLPQGTVRSIAFGCTLSDARSLAVSTILEKVPPMLMMAMKHCKLWVLIQDLGCTTFIVGEHNLML